MYIIVGLGNPGREYAQTRHNIGFMAVDTLAERYNIEIKRHNFRSVFGEGRIGSQRVVLVKPETFMNNSGWAVRDIINWYKIDPEELIIMYDDVDIPVGTIRIKEKGSAGTHNGMRSIVYQLGFDNFPRIRIGIGGPKGEKDMIAHVLSMPENDDIELLKTAIAEAAEAVTLIVEGKMSEAQGKFNKRAHKNKKKSRDEIIAVNDQGE